MTNILQELRSWATNLPYWEQSALEKIVTGKKLTQSDYKELLQYILEDNELEEQSEQRSTLQFPTNDNYIEQSTDQIKLLKISNMENVNALVSGQSLTFGNGLTVIFGRNGSGKSGYARILGCAGFTRGDEEVLPDIRNPSHVDVTPSADIEITDGNSNKIIKYQVNDKCPELSHLYVFDSTSVHVHLTGSNTFSFSPAGLSYLTELASTTDKLKQDLKEEITKHKETYDFTALFQGESEISKLVTNLNADTDIEEVKNLSILSAEEKNQMSSLDIKIAELKTKDISSQLKNLEQKINDLQELSKNILEIKNKLDDVQIKKITGVIKEYNKKQLIIQNIGEKRFKSEHFTQIGSRPWYKFIEATKELAKAEQTPGRPYPQTDGYCLLCYQPLSQDAYNLLVDLLKFEIQLNLKSVIKSLKNKYDELNLIDLKFFNDQHVSYRHIQEHDQELLKKIEGFIAQCHQRLDIILEIIDTQKEKEISKLPDEGILDIKKIIEKLEIEKKELKKEDPAQEISELNKRLLFLQHREVLGQNFPKIQEYIEKLKWAKKASEINISTRHITIKYGELFDKLVTNRYLELFELTLRKLQRPLKIKVKTMGQKSQTYKQIVLETDLNGSSTAYEPEKVLSEGEKRAVAFADFMTEVALDDTSTGIVLDDPVTSLDLEWRDTIASLLVSEATNRQVIIFTHDLPFLYFLKDYAEKSQIDVITHWIKCGDTDNKPGYVFLNSSPALEREYRKAKKAREMYEEAKKVDAVTQENLLRHGFGALRSSYEALIIFDLFNEVIMRFDERISFGRLRDIVWDNDIVDEIIERCEILSRYIEGHLHGDISIASKPTCELLYGEIRIFNNIKKRIKNLKREI